MAPTTTASGPRKRSRSPLMERASKQAKQYRAHQNAQPEHVRQGRERTPPTSPTPVPKIKREPTPPPADRYIGQQDPTKGPKKIDLQPAPTMTFKPCSSRPRRRSQTPDPVHPQPGPSGEGAPPATALDSGFAPYVDLDKLERLPPKFQMAFLCNLPNMDLSKYPESMKRLIVSNELDSLYKES
ncbi:hypothetical protein QR680_014425 [Steinernema hermaphroditum]|uniref:Uncharacterized protein n=2 Tax=Steinernema hermaphroditum TaxID=289476 RepID=A0AA39IB47_9BILA|nr:hypothetical protein QR680_014425 [Steinernema hermaphroditum]